MANRLDNGSFDVNTLGWVGLGATVSRVTGDTYAGPGAARIVTNGSSPAEGIIFAYTDVIAAAPGQKWIFRVWAKGTGTVVPRIGERSGSGSDLGTFAGPPVTLTDAWQEVAYTRVIANASAAFLRPSVVTSAALPAQAVTFLVDEAFIDIVPESRTVHPVMTLGSPHIGPLRVGKD